MTSTPAPAPAELPENPRISIIVPAYCEVENMRPLMAALDAVRTEHGLDLEVIVVDDNSRDGTVETLQSLDLDWVRLIVREDERGLSSAVLTGMRAATGDVLVCMDADLSHDPVHIPRMVQALRAGFGMVVGSRYVSGGSTDDDWGFFRWLNSVVATILARPLTKLRDPMSGFFALRKADFDAARDLNPVGYKIGLELIVKCGFDNVVEIPIHFRDRVHGESKLTLKEQLKYIQHLRRLYLYEFANAMHLLQFLVVGVSGVVVNLAVVSLFKALGAVDATCLAAGIIVSVCTNFLLNRRFTFSYARHGNVAKQFLGFVMASAVGGVVNFFVAVYAYRVGLDQLGFGLQLAALCGIAAGMIFNFLGNRYVVFRKTSIRR